MKRIQLLVFGLALVVALGGLTILYTTEAYTDPLPCNPNCFCPGTQSCWDDCQMCWPPSTPCDYYGPTTCGQWIGCTNPC